MSALLICAGVVAISEVGDKTQLLALLLASRLRQPAAIVAGIIVATVLNHAAAAYAGSWIAGMLDPQILRWGLGVLFLAMAGWALVPDVLDARMDDKTYAGGAFVATAIAFFLAEIGDKTQLATAGLAARFDSIVPVVAGTTLGMLVADVPAVLFGHLAGARLDTRWVRYVAAALFAALGIAALLGVEFV